ncbi:MAG: hypothetical protein A2248_10320 [Candidatus Raymondbacteria bacterium RIFOXYA2_FULL_49_16]|nr:MAG: hypothetical protein A2248_10320 [Candidatus Raymondbacteria bacterium RIFOXYA2_FULL_49_16]OGP43034.1 MAG: hypothetical protein A2324_15005 [Candidatus Raymondbacteria bacterium RIFOXYB2_FULL_49_35]
MKNKNVFLYEVSWEVCNKVGGIYTVIRSKLAETKKEFGGNYILIGPLLDNNPDFIEETGIDLAPMKRKLQGAGITALIGRWNIEAQPRVILIKYKDTFDLNKILYQYWEDFGIDSTSGGWDYQEPVLFSTVAAKVIESLSDLHHDSQAIAQFHEWIAGGGVLYLKKKAPHIATVFTTHATVLGRAMCGNGVDMYKVLSQINTDSEATRYHVGAKHQLESAAAREADCFTAVSEITALEAKHILHVEPKVILTNGFNVAHAPDMQSNRDFFQANRQRLFDFAARFLKKDLQADKTMLVSTSGRYEFHNKGIDLLLDALGELKNAHETMNKEMVVFFFVMAGAVQTSKDQQNPERYGTVCTHLLWDPANDPIINSCYRLNLMNAAADKVHVIFIPAFLNGKDGVFNMEYYEALSGCDLTVYPSYYEPWGYTPLESMSYSVPTVSSDLAGFGRWTLSKGFENECLKVLRRAGKSYDEAKTDLKDYLLAYSQIDATHYEKARAGLRALAMNAEWEVFFRNYIKAFESARGECESRLFGKNQKGDVRLEGTTFRGADSPRPRFRQFSVKSSIPKKIERLRDLAYNIWYAWNADALELFSMLDPLLFEKIGNNPVALLELVEPKKLEEIADNEGYFQLYENVIKRFDKYCSSAKSLLSNGSAITPDRPVAYFSMEFGFHECLPLYSGGLGILSGDHIKSASDVNIPLVGFGLLYKHGYFRQGISLEGEQKVEYFHNDFFRMPLTEVHKNGERVSISIEYPGRTVYARIWQARVGRVTVYFFDTDVQENSPSDREITGKLYGGDKRMRIEQEILLGIGGIRLIEEMNIYPSVYHINEGHSGFLIIERMINLMKYSNLDVAAAKEVIKGSTVFTTHTPVPAGNETFDMGLVETYLRGYVERNGLSWQDFYEFGHKAVSDVGPYEMTVLALKNTHRRNGVSRLHKLVSRKMWMDLWTGVLMEEIPIDHITNGVHVGTWQTSEIRNMLLKYCAFDMDEDQLKKGEWEKINTIPDEVVWQTHIALKNKLFSYVKEKIANNWTREGVDPSLLDGFFANFTPGPLTIGFARRFATYKRPTLFMRDLARLKAMVLNKKHPVQFIMAGKAHPADKEGADLIRHIVELSKKEEFLGKIIFVEDYDMRLARRLVSGVDVWLNNPRRPLEASGTSGQKAGINGIVNFSVLDGWWDEGYDGTNGWVIGERKEFKNPERQDIVDCESLYETLESEIIPTYYSRNSNGVPEKWVKKMKRSLITVTSEFNTHRMLRDYMERMYIPTARKYAARVQNNFAKAKEIAEWKRGITARFSSIHINAVTIEGIQGDNVSVNDEIHISLEVNKGRVRKDEITAHVVIIHDNRQGSIGYSGAISLYDEEITYVPMEAVEENDTIIKYTGNYTADKSGKFNYGVRIMPFNRDVENLVDLNLVYWG